MGFFVEENLVGHGLLVRNEIETQGHLEVNKQTNKSKNKMFYYVHFILPLYVDSIQRQSVLCVLYGVIFQPVFYQYILYLTIN